MKDEERGALPHSLAKVSAFLKDFRPPTGPFDPAGEWEHRYSMWILYPDAFGGAALLSQQTMSRDFGTLRLRRKPAGPEAFSLEVAQVTRQGGAGNFYYCVEARLTCATDRLATPQSWEMRSVMLDRERKPVEGTQVSKSAEVAGGAIRRRGRVERTVPAPKVFTSNWSLFDALQRLPGDEIQPMAFDMLEELDLLKPNQWLSFKSTFAAELGGKPVRLHGFSVIGQAILPYEYWLDDQRRVVMAIGGRRAYLFNPDAELPEARQ